MRALSVLSLLAIVALLAPAGAQATFPGKNGKIAFSTGGIEVIEPDGSGRVQLVAPVARAPAWSADGAKVVYAGIGGIVDQEGSQIFAIDADGGNRVQLTNNSRGPSLLHPRWSPNGGEIVFNQVDYFYGYQASEIYAMHADGSGRSRLAVTSEFAASAAPDWSPTEGRIAFVDLGTNCLDDPNLPPFPFCNSQVYTINRDAPSARVRITDNVAHDIDPSWSPDGRTIAFASSRDDPGGFNCSFPCNYEIYTINVDGTGLTRLTNDPGADTSPAWSPDGRKVVFETNRHEPDPTGCRTETCNHELYTINADGSGEVRLTDTPQRESTPDWQPLAGQAPDCGAATATPSSLWPPNHRLQPVSIAGVTDPDGDPVTITIDGVTQDERVGRRPDARAGSSPGDVGLRAQRRPRGDGRVYRISFSASDGADECTGIATVEVRRKRNRPAVDSAPPSYHSFGQ